MRFVRLQRAGGGGGLRSAAGASVGAGGRADGGGEPNLLAGGEAVVGEIMAGAVDERDGELHLRLRGARDCQMPMQVVPASSRKRAR